MTEVMFTKQSLAAKQFAGLTAKGNMVAIVCKAWKSLLSIPDEVVDQKMKGLLAEASRLHPEVPISVLENRIWASWETDDDGVIVPKIINGVATTAPMMGISLKGL